MTGQRQRALALAAAGVAGLAVSICAAILIADYVAARARAPGDAARIAALQQQAQADASFAPRLAAAQDEITRARRAGKARGYRLSIALVAAAAGFVASSKWRIALDGWRPAVVRGFVRIEPGPASIAARRPTPGVAPVDALDLAFVDAIVREAGRSKEAAIPILQAIQGHFGYLPDEALARVSASTEITPAEIAGTSSFYARFRRSPVGRHVVRVCHGTACHVSGARSITAELRRQLSIPDGADTDPARMFTVDEVACLGCCSLAPVLMIDERTAGRLTPAGAWAALEGVEQEDLG